MNVVKDIVCRMENIFYSTAISSVVFLCLSGINVANANSIDTLGDDEIQQESSVNQKKDSKKQYFEDHNYNILLLMPTAYTYSANTFSFRLYECVFPTFTYNILGYTNLTLGIYSPSDDILIALGFKQKIYQWNYKDIALALGGYFYNVGKYSKVKDEEHTIVLIGSSVLNSYISVHGMFGYYAEVVNESDYKIKTIYDHYGVGFKLDFSKKIKFLAEYISRYNNHNEYTWITRTYNKEYFNWGFRYAGENWVFDIGLLLEKWRHRNTYLPLFMLSYMY